MFAHAAVDGILLDGGAGLQWTIPTVNSTSYALGQPLLDMQPVDAAVDDGIAFWRRESDFLVVPVFASTLVQYRGEPAPCSLERPQFRLALLPLRQLYRSVLIFSTTYPGASIRVSFSSNVSVTGWQLSRKVGARWPHGVCMARFWLSYRRQHVELATRLSGLCWLARLLALPTERFTGCPLRA